MRLNMNAVLIAPIFTMVLLSLPVQAQADWSGAGLHPMGAPNLNPVQGQAIHHETRVNITPLARVEPQHRVQPQPVVRNASPAANHTQPVRHDQPKYQKPQMPDYFRRDANYYGHVNVIYPYADVTPGFTVPDGFDTVMVNGETFYYNRGVFYQQVGDQLTAIPAVLGAIVDYIPQDYQIVLADGVHYLFTGGVFYQRVDQGFQVVQGPVSDQVS